MDRLRTSDSSANPSLHIARVHGWLCPAKIAVDANGSVWTANGNVQSLSKFSSTGIAISPSTGFLGGGLFASGSLTNPTDLTIDITGNAWTCFTNGVAEFSNTGGPISASTGDLVSPVATFFDSNSVFLPANCVEDGVGRLWVVDGYYSHSDVAVYTGTPVPHNTALTGGGMNQPGFIAIDASGNAWIASYYYNLISKISSSGSTAISPSAGFTGGGLNGPAAIAIDASGNAWVANGNGSTLSTFSSSGVAISPTAGYQGGGLSEPLSIAIDGAGQVWTANYGNGAASVSEFNSSGTAISPSTGYRGGGLWNPSAVAIDGSGDVWVTNGSGPTVAISPYPSYAYGSLVQIIGAAVPVSTPLSIAIKNGTVATRP